MDLRTNAPASPQSEAAGVSKDALLVEAAESGNAHTVERLLGTVPMSPIAIRGAGRPCWRPSMPIASNRPACWWRPVRT